MLGLREESRQRLALSDQLSARNRKAIPAQRARPPENFATRRAKQGAPT